MKILNFLLTIYYSVAMELQGNSYSFMSEDAQHACNLFLYYSLLEVSLKWHYQMRVIKGEGIYTKSFSSLVSISD